MDRRARLLQGCLIGAPPPHQRFWWNLEVSKWSISVKFEVFEGLGPSNRTILGKRQPPFFTPREKLTQIRPYLGSRSARNTIWALGRGEKVGYVFWLYFYCFLRTFMPSGGIKGQVVSRRGKGEVWSTSNSRPFWGSQIYVVKILGNFTHLKMRKIGSIFEVWETDFGSLRGHFWPLGGQICPLGGQFEGLGPQIRDPGPWFWPQRGQNLWSQDRFPLWESEFWPPLEVKTRSIWPILGPEVPKWPILGIPAWKR